MKWIKFSDRLPRHMCDVYVRWNYNEKYGDKFIGYYDEKPDGIRIIDSVGDGEFIRPKDFEKYEWLDEDNTQ